MNAASLLVALVAARKEAGLSQRQLAARLGRVHSYVAKIERGQRRLSVPEFLEVAAALAVDPRDLLTKALTGGLQGIRCTTPAADAGTTHLKGE